MTRLVSADENIRGVRASVACNQHGFEILRADRPATRAISQAREKTLRLRCRWNALIVPVLVSPRSGDSSALKLVSSCKFGWTAAVSLALLVFASCAFAQGTKDPSNPIVVYPTNPQRPLDNPPTRQRYIYRYDYSPYASPYGTVDGVVPLRRLHRRYR